MDWATFFAVAAGVIGTHIAQWIGRAVDRKYNWTICPERSCSFRMKTGNKELEKQIMDKHIVDSHPSFDYGDWSK